MDAGVGAAGHGQLDLLAQHLRQARLEDALYGPQPRLAGPATEARAVVFDVEADGRHRRQYR